VLPQDAGFPDPASNPHPSRRGSNPVAGRIDPRPRVAHAEPHNAQAPAALTSSPDVATFLQALKRRWIAAASLGGTLAILAALAAWFLLSPKYIAFGRIRVAFDRPGVIQDTAISRGDFLTYLKTQSAHLTSRPVISSALKRDEVKRLNLEARTGEDPAQFIEKELKVEFQDNQELVTVLMNSDDPQVSLAIVKAVIDSYLDDVVYAERQARVSNVTEMNKALSSTSARLKQHQESLAARIKQAGNVDPQILAIRLTELQGRIRDDSAQQNNIRLQMKQAEADLASHEAKMKALKEMPVPPAAVEAALKADPRAQGLKATIQRAQDVIDDFDRLTPGQVWPSKIAAREKLKTSQAKYKKIEKEVQEELARLAETSGSGGKEELELVRVAKVNTITAYKQRDKELDAELLALNQQLTETRVGSDQSQSQILREQIKQEEDFVNKLALRVQQEEVELQAPPRVTKVQDAELQKKDIKKQVLASAVSPLVVLMAVCMLLAWGEVRHRRIRSAGEVSRGLGIRVVGAVPTVPHLERHIIGPNGEPELEGHPALESIDALRTTLLRDADDSATRMVMVTSATHGEGKTTVASHLASSLARAGRKTLLIDGDLRRPSAHQLFELLMQPGFSEVLLGEVELADGIQATTLDGLSFMAAGQWDREVLQALARDGLVGIFEKLQEEFDFVVIDSHPVLPATDSLLIGQRVDAVILSVLREVSQMPRVYAASQRLTTLGIRVLGAVVNGADPEEALAATASARMVAH
jgi:capsular exopolysaccharide synthesis family protein